MPKLSVIALKERIAKLQKQLAATEANKAPAVRKVFALMKSLSITLTDLTEASHGRKKAQNIELKKTPRLKRRAVAKVAIKFRDASGNTWTGRGKTPRWLVEAEKAGNHRDSFKI
jgi:DNA-binding protein H-NS